jgi:hypothetical protein
VDLTVGHQGNLTTVCIGNTNVKTGQTIKLSCSVPTQSQANGYGVWQANFTDAVTGTTVSSPNSQGSGTGFLLFNATEVDATLEDDCKTVKLTYNVAQSASQDNSSAQLVEPSGSHQASGILATPPRVYTGDSPTSYVPLTSAKGQNQLQQAEQVLQSGHGDPGKASGLGHNVVEQETSQH